MADTSMRYLFLRIYGNDELCAYLTNMLERGWIIDHGRGNFLFFRKQRLPDARLAVVSTECTKRLPTDDEQVDESIEIALRSGWQLLCIGDFESVVPVRRRLYFYTQDPQAKPLEADEAVDFQYARRAYHTTIRWLIIWALLAAATLASTIPFMLLDGWHPAFLLIDAALLSLVLSAAFLFFNRRALYRHVTGGMPLPPDSLRPLRAWETCMALSLAALFAGLIMLLLS